MEQQSKTPGSMEVCEVSGLAMEHRFLSGEIVKLWAARETSRRLMNLNKGEMQRADEELGQKLYVVKQLLCKLGRQGRWSSWLKERNIARSSADRLVLQYAEANGLTDELPHRAITEPLEGDVCLFSRRVSEWAEKRLPSLKSRMVFIRCLADLLGLSVEYEQDGVRVNIPAPVDEENWQTEFVPTVMEMLPDGTPIPVI